MFRLFLSHLQALKAHIRTVKEQCIVESPTLTIYHRNSHTHIFIFIVIIFIYCKRWGSHNALFFYCTDLCLEGLMMTQVESKHVAHAIII
jgi:hypothetical protein